MNHISVNDLGSYKGDSPGKKITRARLWLSAANWMNALGIPYRGALVLTGHGGDIATLKGFGFNPASITSVDRVPTLTATAKAEHPGSYIVTGEVDEVAQHRHYNAVHLDFCNGINVENIQTIANVVRGATTLPCWIGVTMLKAREQIEDKGPLVPDLNRRRRQEMRREYRNDDMSVAAELMTYGVLDPKALRALAHDRLYRIFKPEVFAQPNEHFRMFYKNGDRTSLGSAMVRVDLLRQAVASQLWEEKIGLRPVVVYAYHSGEGKKQGDGTPFFTAGYIAHHQSQAYGVLNSTLELGALMRYEDLGKNLGLRGLKHCALDLMHMLPLAEVSQILSIKRGTLGAWKAHNTMGKYSFEIPDMARGGVGFTFISGRPPQQSTLGWGRTAGSNNFPDSDALMRELNQRRRKRIAGHHRHKVNPNKPPMEVSDGQATHARSSE